MALETKAARLARLFGGTRALARALGVNEAVTSRWNSHARRGKKGVVPVEYNHAIIEAAERLGLAREMIGACLEDEVCPHCGQRFGVEYFGRAGAA